MAYFHGPWFVTPKELPTPTDLTAPGPQFYRQECFLSTISDSNPLLSVVGKCAVMELGDYVTQRPTQYSESDVYVCEAVYDESKRVIKVSCSGQKNIGESFINCMPFNSYRVIWLTD